MSNNAFAGSATFGNIISDAISGFAAGGSPQRSIDNLIPHISTQEVHRDELQITQHPVETGTPVTDHAFPMPYTVEMHVGWSNSTARTSGFVQAVYQALLAVQATRQPISVTTGKRVYSSMLIKSVMINTDVENEFALSVVVLAQQIVITGTQATQASTTPATDGTSQIGTVTPPTSSFDNGIGTVPANSITGGPTTWPNDVTGAGDVQITQAPSSAPTVESLIANGGV